MADKKVERSRKETSFTPSQKLTASLSDGGTLDMADRRHDKGKAVLADKFREREERWRREKSLLAQQVPPESETRDRVPEEKGSDEDSPEGGEGGAR